jgi:hypothetical protein
MSDENLPIRPGIRPETLKLNKIRNVDAETAFRETGLSREGILIPYHDHNQEMVYYEDHDFYRLRIKNPRGGHKYHQRKKSPINPYLPIELCEVLDMDMSTLVIVEGEFKALALAESGIPAVGISGFYGFASKGCILQELEFLIKNYGISEILFLGDSDTSLNWQFADAAVKLKDIYQDLIIRLPRLPLDGPKGIDDLKQEHLDKAATHAEGQAAFLEAWNSLVSGALEVTLTMEPRNLAMTLFRMVVESLKGFKGKDRTEAGKKMAAFASHMHTAERNEIKNVATEMEFGKRDFNSMVQEAKEKKKREQETEAAEFKVDEEDVWFEPERNRYWTTDAEGAWINLYEDSMKRLLVKKGLSKKTTPDQELSSVEVALEEIQTRKNVHCALEVAGYSTGMKLLSNKKILITGAARHLEPEEGDWSLIQGVVDALLLDEDGGRTPIDILYEWTLNFLECLESEISHTGQVLVIAGPKDCGKSLLQNLLTPLFGGRAGLPYDFTTGATNFNADLSRAEHLMIEDETPPENQGVRRTIGSILKKFAANKLSRIHPKHRDAFNAELIQRLTLTTNDDAKCLQVLPFIDETLSDKIILLRAHKRPLPRTPGSVEERHAFPRDLESQLPAFKHYLLHKFKCPERLKSPRFGVIGYQNPDLRYKINGTRQEDVFRGLLECLVGDLQPIGPDTESKRYSSMDLAKMFISNDFSCREEACHLLQAHESEERAAVSVGTFMGLLRKKDPLLVDRVRTSNNRSWLINPKGLENE